MTNHLVIVRDEPFNLGTTVVGKMWVPQEQEKPEHAPAFLEDSDFEDSSEETFEDRIEDKMVKPRGRRPARPTPTEGVETK
jgi:hypothetical protein